MHKIEKTPKVLTIIGLVLEAIGALAMIALGFVFRAIFSSNLTLTEFQDALIEDGMTLADAEAIVDLISFFTNVFLIIGFVILVFFVVNVILFTKLMSGKLTEKQAHKVYLYQSIYGVVNLMYNQIVGILYLVAGIQGYNKTPDKIEVREGI